MPDPITTLNAALEGRYCIERQLGEGGMATVYLARDLKHNRNVALKVLKPELAAVVGAERFLAEIETTANLQHPHILPLFDSGEADSFLFYVMPYVEGESLRERLDREHQLSVTEAVAIATKVAGALQAAHERGVIHRDIKPANILLSKGEPLVSDFGIALALGAAGGGRVTETGLSLGTPHYMSPEQATGDLSVGAATDVYALGCVLYEMLVGDPPYVGSTAQAILGKIVTGEADPVTKHRRSVPPNVDAAIRKALEKVPADRFASAREAAHALGDPSFRHGLEPAGAGTGATGSRWTMAAVAAAALAVGVIGTAITTGAFAPDAPEGVVRFTIEPGADAPFEIVEQFAVGSIAISPAGNLIAYTGPSPDDSVPQLYLHSLDQGVETPLAGTEGGVTPFFSPDGQSLGFVSVSQRELYRIPIVGGAPVLVAEAEGPIAGASWGADDQIIFAQLGPGVVRGLFRVAAGGGEPEQLTDSVGGRLHSPSVIDGENAVLFSVNPALDASTWYVAALDLTSREVTPLGLNGVEARYVASGHLVYRTPDGTVRAVRFDPRSFEVSGSPVSLIESVTGVNFRVSKEGRLIYAVDPAASADGSWELVLVDRDGTEEPLPMPPRRYVTPRVSPDGQRIAAGVPAEDGRTNLWVYDVSSGAGDILSDRDASNAYPVWSRDGSRIYFSSKPELSSNVEGARPPEFGNIYSVPSDGSGPEVRTIQTDGDHAAADVTPDGTLIYEEVTRGPVQLMGVPVDGSGDPFPLGPGQAAAISPDGRWMAYRDRAGGTMQVYVQPYPGPGARVPVSIAGGEEAYWSADGRELYYLRSDGMMMAAEIEGDPTPEVIRRTELFSAAPYRTFGIRLFHVDRDGRFLMLRRPESADASAVDRAPRINVVLNWFEELEARVPAN